MTMNRVQFQRGLSMAEFMDRYGSDDKCEAALIESRWPAASPARRAARPEQLVSARGSAVLPVHGLPPPVQRHQRHDLRGDQAGAVALVPGHAPAHPVQEQRLGPRTHAPPGRLLQDRLAHQAQAHGGHARARGRPAARRPGGDRRRLPWRRALGWQDRAGSENKVPFVAAVQTTPTASRSSCACASSRSRTEEVAVFAARYRAVGHRRLRRPVVLPRRADRRRRAGARRHRRRQGQHEAAAVPRGQYVPGQPQAALGGTYHAFDFAKYAHRYLAEAQYRFNRRFNLRSILARLLRAACVTTPSPARHSCG